MQIKTIPSITDLANNIVLNAKINVVKNKVPNIKTQLLLLMLLIMLVIQSKKLEYNTDMKIELPQIMII